MSNKIELQIHFTANLKEAAIVLSSSTSGELAEYGEALLFNSLALRQLSNLRLSPDGKILENFLASGAMFFWKRNSLEIEELLLTHYTGLGARIIFCTLEWGGPQVLLQVTHHGFGIFGPLQDGFCRSVVAYFKYIDENRSPSTAGRLRRSAIRCAEANRAGMISILNQPILALEFTNEQFAQQ